MEWTGTGIVISTRRYSDSALVIEILSPEQGLHAGLYRPRSRRSGQGIMPGDKVDARWRARLEDHLGVFELDVREARAALYMDDAPALAAIQSACALTVDCLPERQPYPGVSSALEVLFDNLAHPTIWPAIFVRWEAGLLSALGYGLDLATCAATGATEELTHVSPRTGRAVSAGAAEPYLDKLLKLPAFLADLHAPPKPGDIGDGLSLTGFFLERRVLWPADRQLPEARGMMIERLRNLNRL